MSDSRCAYPHSKSVVKRLSHVRLELRIIGMMHDESIMNRQSGCIDAGEVQHDGFNDTAVIKLEMVAHTAEEELRNGPMGS